MSIFDFKTQDHATRNSRVGWTSLGLSVALNTKELDDLSHGIFQLCEGETSVHSEGLPGTRKNADIITGHKREVHCFSDSLEGLRKENREPCVRRLRRVSQLENRRRAESMKSPFPLSGLWLGGRRYVAGTLEGNHRLCLSFNNCKKLPHTVPHLNL